MKGIQLFMALTIAALAACDSAPTAVRAPQDAATEVSTTSTNQPPVADYTWTVLGEAGLIGCPGAYEYEFDGSVSYDPDGYIQRHEWYENGYLVHTGAVYRQVYLRSYTDAGIGQYDGWLVVTDNAGAQDTAYFSYSPVDDSCL